jgi:hypothetical protein
VVGRPADAFGDARRPSLAVGVEDPDGEDAHPGGSPAPAEAVSGQGGHDAGDVGAVAVGVAVGAGPAGEGVPPRQHRPDEILVARFDAGVDYRHGHGRRLDRIPDGFEAELVKGPLGGAERVEAEKRGGRTPVGLEGEDGRTFRLPLGLVGGVGPAESVEPLHSDGVAVLHDGDPGAAVVGGGGGRRRGGDHDGGQDGEAADDGAPESRPPDGVDERH